MLARVRCSPRTIGRAAVSAALQPAGHHEQQPGEQRSDHDDDARRHLRGLAAELGLLVTGSSDFHGENKTVRLGEHTTAPEVLEQLVARATGAQPVTA